MAITAALVKELRDATGAGMMDAKKALTETDGDMEAAVDWLRAKGLAKAAKKAGRTAAEGRAAAASEGGVAVAESIQRIVAAQIPVMGHIGLRADHPDYAAMNVLSEILGGGASSPGFVGHSKFNITQGKFLVGDGGLLRMVWMPKSLKEEIKERIIKRGTEMGVPDLIDKIADETVGLTEEDILPFLKEKGHPALSMEPLIQ